MYEAVLAAGVPAERLFVAGDSGGGNLVTSLLVEARRRQLARPTGLILFSPEISMACDEPSITQNADRDILPWNMPVRPYLHGLDPHDARVSAIDADLRGLPPTFVAYGGDEMFRDPIRRLLILHGDRDVLVPVENAHVLARRIPGARLHIVSDAGHGYPAQDPVGTHQLVTDFFRAN